MGRRVLERLVGGLAFGEGPRWHDGRLWLSDMHDHRVVTVEEDGTVVEVVHVPGRPSGLGWDPQDRLLVVSMEDRRLLRLGGDGQPLEEVADLSGQEPVQCNDMVVGPDGTAYVGGFGFDLGAREEARPTVLSRVSPDGTVSVAADGLMFPNGMVLTADARTLVVGETFGRRMTAFTVTDDGPLADRRTWAELPDGGVPDGCCLDAEGAIWVAAPTTGVVLRLAEGGEVLDRVPMEEGRRAIACMLGGPQGTRLHVLTSSAIDPETCRQRRDAAVDVVDVDVPGAGWP